MRWFLIDRRFQASRENVENVLGPCQKHPANPLPLDGSPDWCHDNLTGRIRHYPDEGVYRGCVTGNEGVYSKDGIEWKRGEPWPGAEELRGDPDPDPNRRYKKVIRFTGPEGQPMLTPDAAEQCQQFGIPPVSGIGVAWSADGATWRYQYPVLRATSTFHHFGSDDWGGGDGYNHIIWAPSLKRYVLFVRTNIDRKPFGGRKERCVGRMESEDLINWTPHQVCLRPWTDWHRQLGFGSHDFYQLPVFFHEGIYWSIGSIFWWQTDTVHLELFWSPDTMFWERVCPYRDFIPQGTVTAGDDRGDSGRAQRERLQRPLWTIFDGNPRAVDSGCNFAIHEPVFLKDEIRVFYGASPGLHNAEPNRRSALCLATFPRDRFAGVADDGRAPGRIVTQPMPVDLTELRFNVDARNGCFRVGLRDETGKPIAGFGLADCRPITDDSLAAAPVWKGGDPARSVKTARAQIEMELSGSTLYSISVGDLP